jgi:hypothetical protein
VGIPGFGVILYKKFQALFRRNNPSGNWSSFNSELPWDILLVLIGWFISVFFLYLTYEFTAEYLGESSSFIRFARFYLPGLFPVVVISALVIARLPIKLYIPVLIMAVMAGSIIYTQYIQSGNNSTGYRAPSGTPGIQQTNRVFPRTAPTGDSSSFP